MHVYRTDDASRWVGSLVNEPAIQRQPMAIASHPDCRFRNWQQKADNYIY